MTDITKIKAFVFDVDGVFTDGGIFCDLKGELYRTFDSKDGFAIRMACMQNYNVGVITGGRSGSIRARFRTCGVIDEDVYLGSRDKLKDFRDFCNRHNLQAENVLYMGDDIPDISVLEVVGIPACPKDAVEEVKNISTMISTRDGGKSCVREIVEKVMKAQGTWQFSVSKYKAKF